MTISLTAPEWRHSSPHTISARVDELRQALVQIKTLRCIVGICACCKKSGVQGFWNQLEVYAHDRTDSGFSYGV